MLRLLGGFFKGRSHRLHVAQAHRRVRAVRPPVPPPRAPPSRAARSRSNAVGEPPRWMWPRMVSRDSNGTSSRWVIIALSSEAVGLIPSAATRMKWDLPLALASRKAVITASTL